MNRIGILRHFANSTPDDTSYVFVGKAVEERFDEEFEEVIVYYRTGNEFWNYDAGKSAFSRAGLFNENTTLYSIHHSPMISGEDPKKRELIHKPIAVAEDPFLIFSITPEEYNFIFDKDRLEDPEYVKNVFLDWRSKAYRESETEARIVLESHLNPNAVITPDLLEIVRQFEVINQLAQIHDPNLRFTDVNGIDKGFRPYLP